MTLFASRCLIPFSASVTRPTLSPSNIFSPAAFSFNHSSCHNVSQFLSSLHMTKKDLTFSHLHVLFISDLVVSASHNTKNILFDLFAIHKIRNILGKNHISVASCFFCNCFNIFQNLHPHIRMDKIQLFKALLPL